MKKVVYKLMMVIFLVGFGISFTSCEGYVEMGFDTVHDDYYEKTDYLCSRVWFDEWHDDFGVYYYQELRFYSNGRGEDYMYSVDHFGYKNERSYSFRWDWNNSVYTSIVLKYGGKDYSYMERIRMGGNKLDCLFDGEPAYFRGL